MGDSEVGEARHAAHQTVPDQGEGLPVEDQVRVVPDEGAAGPEVDDALCRGRYVAEEVHVRHDVVAEAALVLGGLLEIQVVEPLPHLVQGLRRDGEAELVLCLGQGQPQAPPGSVAFGRSEDGLHLAGGVALPERMAIAIG